MLGQTYAIVVKPGKLGPKMTSYFLLERAEAATNSYVQYNNFFFSPDGVGGLKR